MVYVVLKACSHLQVAWIQAVANFLLLIITAMSVFHAKHVAFIRYRPNPRITRVYYDDHRRGWVVEVSNPGPDMAFYVVVDAVAKVPFLALSVPKSIADYRWCEGSGYLDKGESHSYFLRSEHDLSTTAVRLNNKVFWEPRRRIRSITGAPSNAE